MKRFVAMLLMLCMVASSALAEAPQQTAPDGADGWIGGVAEDVSGWAKQAWQETTDWAGHAWDEVCAWVSRTWTNLSEWTTRAWEDASKWVARAWSDSAKWTATNWDTFIVWVNTLKSGDPYAWVRDVVADHGAPAYDLFAQARTFLNSDPDLDTMRQKYNEVLAKLSLRHEDRDILWNMLQEWTDRKGLKMEQTTKLAYPFLVRLLTEGEPVIGEQAVFSGPVVGQYLLTILEALKVDSAGIADIMLKNLRDSLNEVTRPTIIGDTDQNAMVTDDRYYIEHFTYGNGKYQIFLLASHQGANSAYPLLRGRTLKETAERYFQNATFGTVEKHEKAKASNAESLPFTCTVADTPVTGKATAIWTDRHRYLFFVVTDQAWQEEEFRAWVDSISLKRSNNITFEVDMASDGSFYGVLQHAQKYTVNRVFYDESFSFPKIGHGWAGEPGNNLTDNLKGLIKGQHATATGDAGADRPTEGADTSRLLMRTKYYAAASRSIAACFDGNGFRYMDPVEEKPMAVEVPADQYEAAVTYMRNRIANGEVPGVTDVEAATAIVKKGNLTYQQARHIAISGTVASILYDTEHACVTADTPMGLSAAAGYAFSLWNGENAETAIRESLLQGLQTGGNAFIVSVLSSRISAAGTDIATLPAASVVAQALGPKASAVIENAFSPAGSDEEDAAMQSAMKMLRGDAVTSAVTFAVLSADDISDLIRGRISWKQLAKNISTAAIGVAAGTLGYIGGMALGSVMKPGTGTAMGMICAVAAGRIASESAKALADALAEDDADAMIRIIEEAFSAIVPEYLLNQEEANQAVANLQALLTPEMLRQMYQYRNRTAFARQLIETAIDPIVAQRPYIELPSEEEYAEQLTKVLNAISEDVSGEPGKE